MIVSMSMFCVCLFVLLLFFVSVCLFVVLHFFSFDWSFSFIYLNYILIF